MGVQLVSDPGGDLAGSGGGVPRALAIVLGVVAGLAGPLRASDAAVLAASFVLAQAVIGFGLAALGNRFGFRLVVIAGSLLLVSGMLVAASAASLVGFALASALLGGANALSFVCDPPLSIEFAPPGRTSVFLGTVRDVNDGRAVSGIDYQAYERMAADELQRQRQPAIALAQLLSRGGQPALPRHLQREPDDQLGDLPGRPRSGRAARHSRATWHCETAGNFQETTAPLEGPAPSRARPGTG